MLSITVPSAEFWDEKTETFLYTKGATLCLEHSLVSISKWESKHHKAFLSDKTQCSLTADEFVDYVRCMTITQNVDPEVYSHLSRENLKVIREYMNEPMTATHFPNVSSPVKGGGDVKTSEVIYYEMIALGIPFECQKWHLNRLLTLINVCGRKNGKSRPMSQQDIMRNNARINARRRSKYHTKG